MAEFNHQIIEKTWQDKWEKEKIFKVKEERNFSLKRLRTKKQMK